MKLAVRFLMLAVAGLIACAGAAAQSTQMSAAEKEVWQREEDYWKYAQAFDLESYRALWHEEFVGWPRSEAVPVGKKGVEAWLQRRKNTGHTLRYRLERQAVREVEGAVITHYIVHVDWVAKDGKAGSDSSRLTHTWMKAGGRWKIIAGMSAPVEKPAGR